MNAMISLSETERTEAQKFVRQGKANARTLIRAWTLLKLADGWDEAKIAETFAISQATVKNVARRFVQGGLDLVLHDQVQQRRRQALSGQQAAHLIAITCSPAPDGHDHWTVRLLASKAVELGFVSSISPNTISQLLKKTSSNPGDMSTGVCPRSEASLSRPWKMCWTSTRKNTIRTIRPSVWTKNGGTACRCAASRSG